MCVILNEAQRSEESLLDEIWFDLVLRRISFVVRQAHHPERSRGTHDDPELVEWVAHHPSNDPEPVEGHPERSEGSHDFEILRPDKKRQDSE